MPQQIAIGSNSVIYFGRVMELLPRLIADYNTYLVSDKKVVKHHPELFENLAYSTIGQGEKHKTLKSVENLYHDFIAHKIDRSSHIVGIGGGIVTDVAGFAAATYMRGIAFGAVPTTLLAQVDASVGGKTGVNIDNIKNMAGVFSQPRFVICDVELLDTLPEREFWAGMAEVIKTAIIADKELFEILERYDISTLRQDKAMLERVIYRAVKVKADIVSRDEREAGERRLLNLGHTMAHAIEACDNNIIHGEAVGTGIAIATRIALDMGVIDEKSAQRIFQILDQYRFSIDTPIPIKQLLDAASHDKKCDGLDIWFVLPRRIGECCQIRYNLQQLYQQISK